MITTSAVSRVFGRFASTKFPPFFQKIINLCYVKMMKVDLSEFYDSSKYESLNALFTRAFIKTREFNHDADNFISPSDSMISEYGRVDQYTALQIKGFKYNVHELLSKKIDTRSQKRINGGDFVNLYLSPSDYHRYHTPIDMKIQKAVHIPGKLYPVNLKWLHKVPQLFVENERVILECKTMEDKIFYMVFVGALNVGKISFIFDENIQTNIDAQEVSVYKYRDLFLAKGTELGRFEMGSTIVMFFEKDLVTLACDSKKHIKFGEVLASIEDHKQASL
ncbi:phosphatidylserine decarboxylase [Sulfurospirillum sp. 1612]|uniref:phosphatidylserine decarboxylase n=1 Tax=Sulfurospirillum sp. 1612 TaxID=3094835 RepID=UPI002F935CA9